jgi:hypothetical protein
MTAEQRIYDYLIQNGKTNAANTMSMAKLGAWTTTRGINTGQKRLNEFIRRFPELFGLINDNKLIYAITPDILQPQYEDSILEFKPNLPELPVGFEEVDFNTEMQRYPAYDIYTDAMKLERDRAAERTFNRDMPRLNQYFKDAGLPMSKYYQSQESPFSNGGKSESKSRSAKKSRTSRKSRSRRNRNRRTKTARKY